MRSRGRALPAAARPPCGGLGRSSSPGPVAPRPCQGSREGICPTQPTAEDATQDIHNSRNPFDPRHPKHRGRGEHPRTGDVRDLARLRDPEPGLDHARA